MSRSEESGNLCDAQYAGPHRQNKAPTERRTCWSNDLLRQGGKLQQVLLRVLDEVKG